MSTPEIDWTNDESVVTAVYPNTHMYGDGRVWAGSNGKEFLGWWWSAARKHPSVVEFESTHRPQVPAVDVEKELYEALKAVRANKTGPAPAEWKAATDWYKAIDEANAKADAAMKLYEAKGRL
jgi:hypothetical protein